MAAKKPLDRRCTSCNRMVAINWPPGPVPLGHPQVSDHGYFMCGACLKQMPKHCPICKADSGPGILKRIVIDTDISPENREVGITGYTFLIPVSEVA